jgi:hypothetical protein
MIENEIESGKMRVDLRYLHAAIIAGDRWGGRRRAERRRMLVRICPLIRGS